MKKSIILLTVLSAAFAANAQMAEISLPQPILKGVETDMYHPVLSRDGSQLIFTDADYTNLRSYDFNSGAVSKIAANQNEALYAHFGKHNELVLAPSATVRTQGSELIITKDGVEKSYSPVESYAGYLWESVSPDGTKIMFVAAGKGIIITDLDGNIIARPGKYQAPVWFGNDHIIVQNSTDDGHQFNSSQILLLSLDGTQSQSLTKPESMTFSPAASAEAGKVVYTTVDGHLYQINVSLK